MDRILIIESDTQLLEQYSFAFEQVNMIVMSAQNATNALNIVNECSEKQEPIDIILISMQLEGMGAVDFLTVLRNSGNPVSVVAISGNNTKKMLVKLMQLQCADFIETPVTFGLLYTRIHSALQHHRKLYNCVNSPFHARS